MVSLATRRQIWNTPIWVGWPPVPFTASAAYTGRLPSYAVSITGVRRSASIHLPGKVCWGGRGSRTTRSGITSPWSSSRLLVPSDSLSRAVIQTDAACLSSGAGSANSPKSGLAMRAGMPTNWASDRLPSQEGSDAGPTTAALSQP